MSKIDDAVQEAIQAKIKKQVESLIRKRSEQTFKQIEAIFASKKVEKMITKAIMQELTEGISDNGMNYFLNDADQRNLDKRLTAILFKGIKS